QNFSPISNPSPAASAVHSPSCSSSPSPLMGVSEALGNTSNHGPPMSSARSGHGHGRLLQTAPQLSPTPNSNSSISSCGSSGSHKAHNLSAVGGSSLPPDAGLNSLNALSSQVANLPNTVQHMLLTDTVFSHKKRDGGQAPHAVHCVPPSQPRSRNLSAASSSSTVKDVRAGDGAEEDSTLLPVGAPSGTKVEREEQLAEGERGRARQVSGASTGSEVTSYNPTQTQPGQACNVKILIPESHSKEAAETKTKESNIPSSAASPSSEGSLTLHSAPPAATTQNCVPETGLAYNDHRGGEKSKSHSNKEEEKQALEEQQNYSSHHQKSNSGRSPNPLQTASHKYSYPESTYGSDLSMKNRVRAGTGSVMETNPRFFGYQHLQVSYGHVHPKDGSSSGVETLVKRGHGAGSKAQDENSQMQQFPSLLQEVLQGYNLDRRYGRPEQTFPARHQAPQQFPSRHSLDITEVKSEVSNAKIVQNAEKPDMGLSQSHLAQTADSQQPPAKHINLSDFSMPQRKTLSNVQELLLQEPEPLTLTSQTEPQKSGSTLAPSERRSVICDVSPNRRSTPEREREGGKEKEREKSQSAASVIQQPFSSPAAPSDLSKKDVVEKQVKMEMVPKESGNSQNENNGSQSEAEYHSKPPHLSSGVSADPYRRGTVDITPMPSHPVSMTALTSPTRHHSYLHGVDLSSSSSGTFPYRYGDSREDNLMSRSNLHFPSHHPFHHLPPQSQTTSKLQMYPHPRGPPHPPHDMSEWVKAINRPPKEMMMMQHGSSPGRHKANQSEQRQRLIPPADMQVEHTSKTQSVHHQTPYYDMKIWESTHPGREGTRMIHVPTQVTHSHNAAKSEVSRVATEETKHTCPPPPTISKPPSETNTTQPQRPTKTGGSGDTNPLILRRRVRSFISPIPAKRLFQDAPQQRAATNSHHSPGAQSEPSHHNDDDSSTTEVPCPRLSSPQPGENSFLQPLSPSGGNTKVLAARKGRGLKLEAIVQKITPNIKKPAAPTDDDSNHYPGFLHSDIPAFNESQDQDLAHFPRVAGGEDSYMDESHSLNNMIPFRGVDETGPLPTSSFPCESHQSSQVKQQDFDFGLGATVTSASGDKEDFALLGPLPPPPPLPRPVQGSPPPSSSALQHQMSSGRSSLSPTDSKPLENVVPKGYFPSGKKKGRPVGSVNKQKRAQTQVPVQVQAQIQPQSTALSVPPVPTTPPPPTPAPASTPPAAQTPSSTSTPTIPTLSENANTPPIAPPVLTQVVKADVESEDTQPENPNRKGLFIPHIHVEKKIPEIGAVCTIVNAEDDKMKGERSAAGGKAGGVSGKALPSSGYVVTGSVITETNHSGRLLCCLCQKWANYKHLGDLYGPYYPAEYAAKLPKNQPQIRQCQPSTGPNKAGPNLDTNALNTLQEKSPDLRPIPELKRKLTSHPRFKRRHKSNEDSPRMVPSNSKASLPFQPPPPALDSLGPLAQLAQLPQMPMDPEELWVHEGCIVWTSGVYLVNGRLYGLQEALDGARETSCSFCEMVGSTLGCYSKGCTLRYHYLCAIEADCSLNEDNFSLRCPKHKFTQSIRPAKPVYVEQSERG
uniref:Transcription factor 20 n=1 Tax=Poecilia formosa TaxID=48698 RepID=A0A096M840_POEFO